MDIDDASFVFVAKIKGVDVTFNPLNIDDFYYLFNKFPALWDAFSSDQEVKVASFVKLPNSTTLLAEIVACSTGRRGVQAEIDKAMKLSASKQVQLANKIYEASVEDGSLPFVEGIGTLAARWIEIAQPPLGSIQTPSQQSASPASGNGSSPILNAGLVGTPRPPRGTLPPEGSQPSTAAQPPKPIVRQPVSPSR
jgi:hypothetical protein